MPPLELHRAQQLALERVAPPHVIGANAHQLDEARVFQWTDNRIQLGLDLAAINDGAERRKKMLSLMRDQGVGINKVINAFIIQQSQKLRALRNKMSALASQSVDHLGSALVEFLRLVEASNIQDIHIPANDVGINEGDIQVYIKHLLNTVETNPSTFTFTLSDAANADDVSNASYRTIRDTNAYILQNLNRITANVMSSEFEHMDNVRRGLSQTTHRRFLRQQKIDLKRRVSRIFNWIGMKIDTSTHHVSVRSGIPLFLLQTLLLVIGTLTLHVAAQYSLPYLQTTIAEINPLARVNLASNAARWWTNTVGISVSNTLMLLGVSAVLWQFGAFFQRALVKTTDVLERYNIPYWVRYISSLVFSPVRAVYNAIWRTEEAGNKLLAQTVGQFQTPDKVIIGGGGKTGSSPSLANTGMSYDPIDDIIRSYFFTRVCAELMVFYNNLLVHLADTSPLMIPNDNAAYYRTTLNYFLLLSSLYRSLKDVTSVIEFWQQQRYEWSILHLQHLGNSLEAVLVTSIAFKNARVKLVAPIYSSIMESATHFDAYSDQLYGFLKSEYAHLRSLISAAERDRTLVERMRLERVREENPLAFGGIDEKKYIPPVGGTIPVTGANTLHRTNVTTPRMRSGPATTTISPIATTAASPMIIFGSPMPQKTPLQPGNTTGGRYYDDIMSHTPVTAQPLRTPIHIKTEPRFTPQTSYTTPTKAAPSRSVYESVQTSSAIPVFPSDIAAAAAAAPSSGPVNLAVYEETKPPTRVRLSRLVKAKGANLTQGQLRSKRS